jgi:hypothetical protein
LTTLLELNGSHAAAAAAAAAAADVALGMGKERGKWRR